MFIQDYRDKTIHALRVLVCCVTAATTAVSFTAHSQQTDDSPVDSAKNGETLFSQQCLVCHQGASPEAPLTATLKLYTPERIVDALETGVMSTQGIPLSKQDKRDVAFFLTGKSAQRKPVASLLTHTCTKEQTAGDTFTGAKWNGWGLDLGNQRFQSAEQTLSPLNVGNLTLEWAYAFPQTTRVRSQPVVFGDWLFIGSQEGVVYALDAKSGCTRWIFQADSEVRGAIHVHTDSKGNPEALLFGDFKANAYSISALDGRVNWKTKVRQHPLATITGSLSAWQNLVYVPTSSSEVISAAREDYPCCSFRGALVALDLDSGEIRWTQYTTDAPKPTKPNRVGVMQAGPSGAPIWSRPAVDIKRKLVYVTTGQNYSSPATHTSDAIIAMSATTGEVGWVTQVTANDAWNGACVRKTSNCPEEDGPDFDIGSGALMVTHTSGKELILIGQKSGMVYALDPDAKGKILWKTRVGKGGTMGGVHWGMSADDQRLYVGVSDLPTRNPYAVGDPFPGVASLDLLTGDFSWRQVLPNKCPETLKFRCFEGISAAVSASPGLVFAGGLDGILRAFDAKDGRILWEQNTHREFDAVNQVAGNGGAIEADGPVIVDGSVFVTSGYDKWGEIPGNVLLKYSLNPSSNAEER